MPEDLKLDTDRDGVTDIQETKYKTDLTNPGTDGEEVQKGW